MAEKEKKNKLNIDNQYFQEARSWDIEFTDRVKKSEKMAWFVAIIAVIVALAEAIGISFILPLKTIEPYVITVDKSTGIVDVISRLDLSQNIIDDNTQEAIDKYWIHKYIINRESYSWNTLQQSREVIGVLSTKELQYEYDNYNNPKTNPNAPVTIFGYESSVEIFFKSLTFIKSEIISGIERKTALIRIIKTQKRGAETLSSHWQVTLTYSYFNTPVKQSIRYLNPLGFQVLFYRLDPETMEQ